MAKPREVWVLPEISNKAEEISKLSLGLCSEAKYIAEKVNGTVTALVLGDRRQDYSEVFSQYGVTNAYVFEDPILKYFSADAYSAALVEKIQDEKPWLLLMGNTIVGKELAPRLAVLLGTGLISNCVKMDFTNPESPRFYRPVYGGQLYQEVAFQTSQTMLVTMDQKVLYVTPWPQHRDVKTSVFKPRLSPDVVRVKHLEFLPADFRTVDVADAKDRKSVV